MSYDATWDAMQAGTRIRSLTMPLGNEPTREMERARTPLAEPKIKVVCNRLGEIYGIETITVTPPDPSIVVDKRTGTIERRT